MLQHIWARRCTWAIATVLAFGSAFACGDDEGDNDEPTAGSGGKGGAGGKGGSGGAGGSVDEDAGVPSDTLRGTAEAAECQSFTPLTDDKCQGWYCGVTEAQLKAEVNPKARCGGDVALLCKGTVTKKVGECAREEKLADLAASNEVLRPRVRDCAYKDDEIKEKVPESCLNCVIDVAACASDRCLGPCLTGDSEGCDNCRITNQCDTLVFSCGQIPSPF